jgi:hypothetical protein
MQLLPKTFILEHISQYTRKQRFRLNQEVIEIKGDEEEEEEEERKNTYKPTGSGYM